MERKLLSPRSNVHKSVDRFPAQVLQGGQAAGERFDELQRDLLSSRVDRVVPFALRHVIVDQLEDTVKVRNGLNVLWVRLQVERAGVALDAQVLGA